MINGGSRQQSSFLSVARKGPAPPPLFLDQTEAQRSKFCFFRPGPALSQGLDDWASPLAEGLDPPLLIPMIVIAKASLRI